MRGEVEVEVEGQRESEMERGGKRGERRRAINSLRNRFRATATLPVQSIVMGV